MFHRIGGGSNRHFIHVGLFQRPKFFLLFFLNNVWNEMITFTPCLVLYYDFIMIIIYLFLCFIQGIWISYNPLSTKHMA